MTGDRQAAPEEVECPCGNGEAVPAPVDIRETKPANPAHDGRTTVTVNYRHEGVGCDYGGAVILEAGEVVAMVGPLFEPERYVHGTPDAHVDKRIRHRDPETGHFTAPGPDAIPEVVRVAADGGAIGEDGGSNR